VTVGAVASTIVDWTQQQRQSESAKRR